MFGKLDDNLDGSNGDPWVLIRGRGERRSPISTFSKYINPFLDLFFTGSEQGRPL
jgi:hypothetical protein